MSARDDLEGALDAACPHEEGQRRIDAFAHELAQTQRAGIEGIMERWDGYLHQDMLSELIDLIDPEAKP